MSTALAKTVRHIGGRLADSNHAPIPTAVAKPAVKTTDANEIRTAAYYRWVTAGKPPGDGVRFWLESEKELLGKK